MKASIGILLAGAAVATLAACSSPAVSPSPPAPTSVTKPASSGNPVAPRPSDAALKIITPKAGEAFHAGPVKVSVTYTGPALISGAEAKKLDDYHLHYFLDEDAGAYLGSGMPIPAGNPKIVHSAAKEVNFDNLPPGAHTVSVVMSGNNHVSVSTPVSDTVSFSVK
jgi:hypothetical protein